MQGRSEEQMVYTSATLHGCRAAPHVLQVFRTERLATVVRSGKVPASPAALILDHFDHTPVVHRGDCA